MWKPLNNAIVDPDELQIYIDQGWKEVGWTVCKPLSHAGDTYGHVDLKSLPDPVRGGRNDAN